MAKKKGTSKKAGGLKKALTKCKGKKGDKWKKCLHKHGVKSK